MNKNYYAVSAENGFCVFGSYDYAMKCKKYLKHFLIRKFDNFSDAMEHAISIYNDMQCADGCLCNGSTNDITFLNKIFFRKDILMKEGDFFT